MLPAREASRPTGIAAVQWGFGPDTTMAAPYITFGRRGRRCGNRLGYLRQRQHGDIDSNRGGAHSCASCVHLAASALIAWGTMVWVFVGAVLLPVAVGRWRVALPESGLSREQEP